MAFGLLEKVAKRCDGGTFVWLLLWGKARPSFVGICFMLQSGEQMQADWVEGVRWFFVWETAMLSSEQQCMVLALSHGVLYEDS